MGRDLTLLSLALALQEHGHDITLLGEAGVAASLSGLPASQEVLPAQYDLGPRFAAAVREAVASNDGKVELGGLTPEISSVVDLGWGYGTFTVPTARQSWAPSTAFTSSPT